MSGSGKSGSGNSFSGKQVPLQQLARLVDLFFEVGVLRHVPRSGYIFLGTGSEDVAQHSFRVAFMSFVLARMAGADPYRAALLGLTHDLHEARVSDLNYMNQRYVRSDHVKAQEDALEGTGLEDELMSAYREFEARESLEAKVAKDADQLDLLFNLKVELDKGNAFAKDWIESALGRLKTSEAQSIASEMLATDHNRWWFGRVDKRWWVNRCLPEKRKAGPHAVRRPQCARRRAKLWPAQNRKMTQAKDEKDSK